MGFYDLILLCHGNGASERANGGILSAARAAPRRTPHILARIVTRPRPCHPPFTSPSSAAFVGVCDSEYVLLRMMFAGNPADPTDIPYMK